jgi:transposase
MRQIVAATLILLLAACATPEPVQEPPAPAPVAEKKPRPERIESQPLKHLLNRNLKPMPVQALNVKTKCAFRDAIGTRGKMDLQVKNAEVQRFTAEINIPKQGICRFDMKNFEQTGTLPNVMLTDASSGCAVRMWAQELGRDKSVTVAFSDCQTQCSGDSFSYLWPILVDTRNGRCS